MKRNGEKDDASAGGAGGKGAGGAGGKGAGGAGGTGDAGAGGTGSDGAGGTGDAGAGDKGAGGGTLVSIAMPVLAVLGGLCVLYGLAVLALRSGTLFFAFWLVLGAALLAGAWALHTGAWNAIGPVARRGICAVLCVLAVGFAGTQALVFQNFNDQGEDGLDYLVVLGAQVRADGPSPVLRYRLDTAYDYLQRNPGTRCIVSGSQGFNEPAPEAHVMADYLQARGIAPDRILVEDASTNTAQNMANSAAFFDPASARVGVVTNNFHVYRALRIAHKQGLSHVCGIAAPSLAFWLPNNLARESVSIAKAFALGDM